MPQNGTVSVGHLRLFVFFFCCLSVASCQKSISSLNFDYAVNKASPTSAAIDSGAWEKVLKLSADSSDPLLALIRVRALYELRKFDEVLSSPLITDVRFACYDTFLRSLSAYENEKFDEVLKLAIPADLPRPLRERLWLLHGEAYQEKMELEKAREIYESFLKDFRRSPFTGDVLIRLADIRLSLGDEEKSTEHYEELYQFFPLADSEDIARQKLIESGRFAQIDTDAHLTRIQQLRRSAHFKRALQELEGLLKGATKERRARLELALAQVKFGEKNYRESEKLARRALMMPLPEDLELEWRQLLASSYIRLSEHEKGEKQYKLLLDKKISSSTRELILLRLGLASLDHFDYKTAAAYFERLRKEFPKGSYIESAHWFGAFTAFLLLKDAPDEDQLKAAIELLDDLENLPQGVTLAPQAAYWKIIFAKMLKNEEEAKKFSEDLDQKWPLSFHALLLNSEPFQFLQSGRFIPARLREASSTNETSDVNFGAELAWQRLELFRSVNLKTWAAMELDQFLDSNRNGSKKINLAVAEKLEAVEDWANLFRWADKNLSRPLKKLDLSDPIVKYHYPKAYERDVLKQAEKFGVSPFLIWGVMREESRYRSDVISAAGAVGLMQVMPSLGKRIGSLLREPANKRGALTEAQRNVRYGTYHLMELKKQVDRLPVPNDLKPILQVAAYNAGIEAVRRWIKDKDSSKLDIFVESIPFQETRGYVKRVLQSADIYYKLYGDAPKDKSETEKP